MTLQNGVFMGYKKNLTGFNKSSGLVLQEIKRYKNLKINANKNR